MSEVLLKPRISISTDVLEQLKTKSDIEQQVIVHCTFKNTFHDICFIRIWTSTFLFAHESSHKSELLHIENIPLAPTWKPVYSGQTTRFTLIFSCLPKDCLTFDLKEVIPEAGGYEILNIKRNKTDVYSVQLK